MSFIEILTLFGALGVFLFGMKLMSESLQKVGGHRMRDILSSMTSNRVKGVFTGVAITALIQSSSATTVMIVSFVNAGLLTLVEAIGVIMGANVGTTVTSWMITILGFKVSMSAISLPLIGVSMPLLFSSNRLKKSWGELIIGFSLIFIGLQFLKDSVPNIKDNPEVLSFLADYGEMGFSSIILFVFIGTVMTVIVQSSSAALALTLVMCSQGWITFELATAMVLGQNMGTTITANLAAMVANVSARRAAMAHLIFNLLGVVLALALFYPSMDFMRYIMDHLGHVSPFVSETNSVEQAAAAMPVAISIYHTLFNILNTFILIWFVNQIAVIVTKMIKSRETSEEEFNLKHINSGLTSTPDASIYQARQEILHYAERSRRMFGYVLDMLHEPKDKKYIKLQGKIEKYEEVSDRMEVEIAEFLTQVGETKLSETNSQQVSAMYRIIDNIESIGDSCNLMSVSIDRKRRDKIEFSEDMAKKIDSMFALVDKSIVIMIDNLSDSDSYSLEKAQNIEREIDNYRDILKREHLLNIKEKAYSYDTGIVYNDLYSHCESVGDQVINVTEALDTIG